MTTSKNAASRPKRWRLTVRQEPSERGLARVCQGPRGFHICLDGDIVARVGSSKGFGDRPAGWHFYGGIGKARRNSAAEGTRFDTKEAARDACLAWLRELVLQIKEEAAHPPDIDTLDPDWRNG